jgi:pimeloyl-ACP methyl ester carboxylesterase
VFYATFDDPRHKRLWERGRACFHQAIRLLSPAPEIVAIPFGAATLPGYFIKGGEGKRPTLLALTGFDGMMEESLHWIGFAAALRGWNCLAFEGPGQWSALYLNPGLTLRHDYEVPMRAVVDYVVQRPEVDAERLALVGYSLGGYWAPRVAAFEPRIRACIADNLVTELGEAFQAVWPSVLRAAPPAMFDSMFSAVTQFSQHARWSYGHMRWTMGLQHPNEILDAWKPFTLIGTEDRLQCPLLCLYGEDELGQMDSMVIAEAVMRYLDRIQCDTTIHVFPTSEGAGAHCQVAGLTLANEVIFDWLDQVFSLEQAQQAPAFHLDPQFISIMRRFRGKKFDELVSKYRRFADPSTSAAH